MKDPSWFISYKQIQKQFTLKSSWLGTSQAGKHQQIFERKVFDISADHKMPSDFRENGPE
jgi:hypothetical protein